MTAPNPRKMGVGLLMNLYFMPIDLSRCRLVPFAHQVEGVEQLVRHPFFALFDEMGAGKSKQVIDAAQVLYSRLLIDRVIIIAPAAVRAVWYDPELGELKKHLWESIPARITEYHARNRSWIWGEQPALHWIVTNYELVRQDEWMSPLLKYCSEKTLLVLDESSSIKNWKAKQTEACYELRKKCGRVVLLNGTPIANNPLDMFAQGNMLDTSVLDCKYITRFRARYANMEPIRGAGGRVLTSPKGFTIQHAVGWKNLDDLQKRFAPYVLRRLKDDCLDLPEKLPSVSLVATMTPTTWRHYKSMRDDMVTWLSENTVSAAMQAGVKAIRLAQITSGFLGGVQMEVLSAPESGDNRPEWVANTGGLLLDSIFEGLQDQIQPLAPVQEVGREKLDVFLDWLERQLDADPNLKLLVQCRFRPELARAVEELNTKYPRMDVGAIWGAQKKSERQDALRLLDPRTAPKGPATVFATSAGSMGLNLTAAHTVFRLSRDFSLWKWLQGEDRVHRPGQVHAVSYYDVVAEGPKGQRTIDHSVLAALLGKQDVAKWVQADWVNALKE